MAQRFEELIIWQDARMLANLVHSTFLEIKDWDYKSQINRVAISVMNNIAEGFERYSKPDFKRFLQIAKASNGEVRSMTYLAQDFNYIKDEQAEEIRKLSNKIKTEIVSLMNKL
ncbi:MAG: four helix bundle protein [Bacteroidales bacterium]